MKPGLRVHIPEDVDYEMEVLKSDLMELYPDRAEAIKMQTDFGVLAYLKCCTGKGPTSRLHEHIQMISEMDEFKKFFLPAHSVTIVDEDAESDDSSDSDYVESSNPSSSQESASSEDEALLQNLQDSADDHSKDAYFIARLSRALATSNKAASS
ncbi:hypothetical protein BGZ98_006573, partial [Dissophora globulifera]